jgi:hypothetical protein
MSNEISIDGIKYVRADTIKNSVPAKSMKGLKYCIVRTYSAGVFAGYIGAVKGKEITVHNARRLWYWEGASSLSQLSQDGVSKPDKCKFPAEVPEVYLTEVIEVLPCTEKARLSIAGVSVWKS